MHKLPRANAINSLPISLNFHKKHLKPQYHPLSTPAKPPKSLLKKNKPTSLKTHARHHPNTNRLLASEPSQAKPNQAKPSQASASKETPPIKMLKRLLPS